MSHAARDNLDRRRSPGPGALPYAQGGRTDELVGVEPSSVAPAVGNPVRLDAGPRLRRAGGTGRARGTDAWRCGAFARSIGHGPVDLIGVERQEGRAGSAGVDEASDRQETERAEKQCRTSHALRLGHRRSLRTQAMWKRPFPVRHTSWTSFILAGVQAAVVPLVGSWTEGDANKTHYVWKHSLAANGHQDGHNRPSWHGTHDVRPVSMRLRA